MQEYAKAQAHAQATAVAMPTAFTGVPTALSLQDNRKQVLQY
jgi:hypothetical protein